MGLYVDVNTLKLEYEERIRKRREPYARGPFFGGRAGEPAGLGRTLQTVARAVASILA